MPTWPAPTDEATGEFAPGDDTGATLIASTSGFPFELLHWASSLPMVLLIVARLGSVDPGEEVTVAWAGDEASGDKQIRFRATRSMDGTEVVLGFDLKAEFTTGYQTGSAPAQPWAGPDHVYAWAAHEWQIFDSRVSRSIIASKLACESASPDLNDYSGAGHLAHTHLSGEPFVVPSTAPSDLRVMHIALWWELNGTDVPTADEINAYMGRWTCRQWSVGRVAWGIAEEWH